MEINCCDIFNKLIKMILQRMQAEIKAQLIMHYQINYNLVDMLIKACLANIMKSTGSKLGFMLFGNRK